jgi:hypothetical protein
MDLSILTDETLRRYYEDIRAHVSTDIRSGGIIFSARQGKTARICC